MYIQSCRNECIAHEEDFISTEDCYSLRFADVMISSEAPNFEPD